MIHYVFSFKGVVDVPGMDEETARNCFLDKIKMLDLPTEIYSTWCEETYDPGNDK